MPLFDKENAEENAEERSFIELEESMQKRLAEREKRLEEEKNLIPDNAEKGDVERITDKVLLAAFAKDMDKTFFEGKTPSLIDFTSKETIEESTMRMDEALRKEDHVPVEDEIPENQDLLGLILQDVRVYCGIKATANTVVGMKVDAKRREERLIKRIMRRVEALSEQMEAQNEEANRNNAQVNAEIEAEAERRGTNPQLLRESLEYQNRWKEGADDERMYAVSNLKAFFEAQLYGKLGLVPEEPILADAHHMIVTDAYIRNGKYEEAALKEQNLNVELEEDRRTAPLFPHAPSPNDIQQYAVGDCFLLATLSEIAAKHPEKIREMIRDNQDGTATVRLYHRVKDGDVPDAFEPFYVTVDKIVTKGQAREALWVQTIERAYAVSGLLESEYELEKQGVSVESETHAERSPHPFGTYGNKRPKNKALSFDIVDGSRAAIAMSALLGNDAATKVKSISAGIVSNGSGPLTEAQLPVIRADRLMNKRETEYVNAIKKATKAGAIVCAASCNYNGNDRKAIAGINKNHMYSVLGIVEKEIGGHKHCFVKLRNPHGNVGRDYKLVNTPEGDILKPVSGEAGIFSSTPIKDGTCYVEIRHFKHEFWSLSFANVKESSLTKTEKIADEELKTVAAYRKAFKEIYKYLDESVSFLKGSSKEYDALKAALKTAYKKPAVNYAELEKHVDTLYEAMNKYLVHSAEVAGDPTLRMHKQHACNALSTVLRAAGMGFMEPKKYAKEVIADRVLDEFESKYKEVGRQNTPEEKAALDLIQKDRAAARKNVMRSGLFQKSMDSDADMIFLGKIAYARTNVFKVINTDMVIPVEKAFAPKTTDQLRAERTANGPANGPQMAPGH